MSQVFSLQKEIGEKEFLSFIDQDGDISIIEKLDSHINLTFSPSPQDHLIYEHGILLSTSPSELLYAKLELIAERFNTQVCSEDEDKDESEHYKAIPSKGFDIWLGWPIIAIIITIYLVSKWLS